MVNGHHVIASSVKGYSHVMKGLPNQDAYRVIQKEGLTLAIIADGHGSKTCFRSHEGAAFAVAEAGDLMLEGLKQQSREFLHDPQKLFKLLLKRWAMRILKHLKTYPFSQEEIAALSPQQRKTIGKNALVAYGSTLNMVLTLNDKLYLWKVGDGAMLIREERDAPVKELMDRKWIGVETLSLSTCNPAKDVEFMIHSALPKDFLMCSDGYKNAFRTDAGFYQALVDFSHIYETQEAGYIETHVEEWLKDTSRMGSGDDITLVLLLRGDKKQ